MELYFCNIYNCLLEKNTRFGTSLVVQWLRTCLPMKGPWVLIRGLRSHIPWSNQDLAPQLLRP